MSRIGNQPIVIPSGVNVSIDGSLISVEGPLGKLSYSHRPEITAVIDDGKQILIQRSNDNKESRAYHGLTRALVQNMVEGVTKGYEKKLEIVGVGYLAAVQEDILQLHSACHQKHSQTSTDAQLRASWRAVSRPGTATAPPTTVRLSRG